MATREQTLIGAFAALEGAHFYSAFLPSLMTIRMFAQDEEALKSLRQGEAIATSMTLLLGWVLSELVDSYLPLVFVFAVALFMLTVYEFGIQRSLSAGIKGAALETLNQFIPMR